MTQTYQQMTQKIATLQAKAEQLKQKEVQGVIARIRTAIDAYGLTAQQLFGQGRSGKAGPATKKSRKAGSKYRDEQGNVWGGMGPRPRWLREALASGRQLAEFLDGAAPGPDREDVQPAPRAAKPAAKRRKKARARKASAGSASTRQSYTDGVNQWKGFGPRPQWLKDALAGGKSLAELKASETPSS